MCYLFITIMNSLDSFLWKLSELTQGIVLRRTFNALKFRDRFHLAAVVLFAQKQLSWFLLQRLDNISIYSDGNECRAVWRCKLRRSYFDETGKSKENMIQFISWRTNLEILNMVNQPSPKKKGKENKTFFLHTIGHFWHEINWDEANRAS